jgi:hypothetical protein
MIDQELRALEVRWSQLDTLLRTKQLAAICALAIGRFIRIHPFLNGNGRTSRLLWAALLTRFAVPPQARIVPRPEEPYSQVMRAAMHGDDGPLMALILAGMATATPSVQASLPF